MADQQRYGDLGITTGNKGWFGPQQRPAAPEGTLTAPAQVAVLEREDTSIARAEAFETLSFYFPGTTPSQFEDLLFDTWDTAAEFDAYTSDVDNELAMLGPDRTTIYDLPSGGVAAFYNS
jgi:hypothetical protein